ncbi:MAG: NCS2 family permease, partial [Pseudomonadota bacterium]
MKPFVKGDIEGFFAFGLDALLAFILMNQLCTQVLGFSAELFYQRILPAAALALIVGNLFYAWQALKLARRENRSDVCAIPYGTSTITVIIFVFLVMLPVQQKALGAGMSKDEADLLAWHTGLLACLASGSVEFLGSFVAARIRTLVPQVVMLVAIAGTGLAFISMDYIFRTFSYPLIGFATLALCLVFYFGNRRMLGGIPAGFVIVAGGTTLAWALHAAGADSVVPGTDFTLEHLGFHLPIFELHRVFASAGFVVEYLPIILPFGFIFLIGSLQNIEAAAAAGDSYNPRPLLIMNGAGSLAAAGFGSPFPTSIFLGHPGYKAIGARAGYSTLNGIFWTLVCLTGTVSLFSYVIPIEAAMPILIWIGVVMCSQNFQISERRYIPAIVLGLTPAFAAYVGLTTKHALSVAGSLSGANFYEPSVAGAFVAIRSFYADGMFALGQGYIYTCMVLAAIVYYVIDGRFRRAAAWCAVCIALSVIGF